MLVGSASVSSRTVRSGGFLALLQEQDSVGKFTQERSSAVLYILDCLK